MTSEDSASAGSSVSTKLLGVGLPILPGRPGTGQGPTPVPFPSLPSFPYYFHIFVRFFPPLSIAVYTQGRKHNVVTDIDIKSLEEPLPTDGHIWHLLF